MDHRLISFDGTSGTGKSTICRLTKDYLVEKGYDCQIIKFPSGHLRDLIQDERYSETRDPFLESYLFAASFRGLIVRNVIPVKDQTIFLFDRSYITSYVDSNYGSNNIENIIEINKYNPKFDLSFILYNDAPTAMKRIRKRAITEGKPISKRETLEYISDAKDKYLSMENILDNLILIDAEQSVKCVLSEIINKLNKELLK